MTMKRRELYNLIADPGETTPLNLSESRRTCRSRSSLKADAIADDVARGVREVSHLVRPQWRRPAYCQLLGMRQQVPIATGPPLSPIQALRRRSPRL